MTRIVESLSEVSGAYDALLCDLWGCYHDGVSPHVAAESALRAYRKGGGVVALLTNAPRPHATTAAQLARMGAAEDTRDLIVTSGDATVQALESRDWGRRCHHVGPQRDLDLFTTLDVERTGLAEADFILCSGLFDDSVESPADYADVIACGVKRGLPMVCANPDIVVDRGETRLYCAGAIAQAYAEAGGEAHLYGKPHAPIYGLALRRMSDVAGQSFDRKGILAIGDGPATDVKGGEDHGFDTLFVAGGLGAEALLDADGAIRPDALDAYLTEHGRSPTYAISMLR